MCRQVEPHCLSGRHAVTVQEPGCFWSPPACCGPRPPCRRGFRTGWPPITGSTPTSGLTAVDETGAHNGTLTGALDWVPGVEGNALQFRGGNGSPFVNTGAWQTTGPAGLSIALWTKWAGANSLYQGLIGQRDGTMYWWIEMSPDAAQLRFKSNTSPQSNLFLSTPHLVKDEWMHVAFSHDAAAKRGVVYLNGQEKLAGAWSLPTGNFATYRTGIGVVNCADGLGTFNGTIDEAMIFQRPLTAAEVKDAMDGFTDPTAAEPSPADGQSDVPTDVILAWMSNGHGRDTRRVSRDQRRRRHGCQCGRSSRRPVGPGLTDTTYEPATPLEYGKTYFWRIDEVNGAPTTRSSRARPGASRPNRSRIRSPASSPRPVPSPRAWARRRPSMAPGSAATCTPRRARTCG